MGCSISPLALTRRKSLDMLRYLLSLVASTTMFLTALPSVSAAEQPTDATGLTGGWSWSQDFGQGEVENLLVLQTQGNTLSGNYQRDDQKLIVKNGKVNGSEFTFTLTSQYEGQTIEIKCRGKVDGDKMNAVSEVIFNENSREVPFEAKRLIRRPEDVVGLWTLKVEAFDRVFTPEIKIELVENQLKGQYISKEAGTHPIQELSLKGSVLAFGLQLQAEGNTLDLKYEGVLVEDEIEGTLHYEAGSTSDSTLFTGNRTKP